MKVFLAVMKGIIIGLIKGICGIITALFILGLIGIDSEYGFGYALRALWDTFTGKTTGKEFYQAIEKAL